MWSEETDKLYTQSVYPGQHNHLPSDLKSKSAIRAAAKARLDGLRRSILAYRLSRDLTLIELEKLTGVPKSTLATLEGQSRRLRSGTIRKIESFLEKVDARQPQ